MFVKILLFYSTYCAVALVMDQESPGQQSPQGVVYCNFAFSTCPMQLLVITVNYTNVDDHTESYYGLFIYGIKCTIVWASCNFRDKQRSALTNPILP